MHAGARRVNYSRVKYFFFKYPFNVVFHFACDYVHARYLIPFYYFTQVLRGVPVRFHNRYIPELFMRRKGKSSHSAVQVKDRSPFLYFWTGELCHLFHHNRVYLKKRAVVKFEWNPRGGLYNWRPAVKYMFFRAEDIGCFFHIIINKYAGNAGLRLNRLRRARYELFWLFAVYHKGDKRVAAAVYPYRHMAQVAFVLWRAVYRSAVRVFIYGIRDYPGKQVYFGMQ